MMLHGEKHVEKKKVMTDVVNFDGEVDQRR